MASLQFPVDKQDNRLDKGRLMTENAILTITRNSSHIWHKFADSYKKHCENYNLYLWDNKSRAGDLEYLMTYADEGFMHWMQFGDANYLHSTDHYYEYVSNLGITWTSAKTAAENRTYFG